MNRESEYQKLRWMRIKIGAWGFAIGAAIGIPITYLVDGVYFNLLTFVIAVIGLDALLALFQRTRDFPTADQVKALKAEKQLNPLGIEHRPAKNI